MGEDRKETLKRIDAALLRMKARGYEQTAHYARLKAKRDAIAGGAPYAVYDVAPYLIRAFGAQIPNINCGFDGKLIKARGKWQDVVAPAYVEATD